MAEYSPDFAIATSFQKEGMVIVDMTARLSAAVRVFTLDTGRLPEETFRMIDLVRRKYGIETEVVTPDAGEVARMVLDHGADLFYDGVEFRHLCCEVRKVRPLQRKLSTLRAWASGIRREQADTRAETPKLEFVDGRLIKLNPLADWSAAQVEDYIREHDVPVHPLYARGYASIGCAPCTRAIQPGEDQRAGRWWWETGAKKECGIHFDSNGKVRRAS